MKVDLVCIFPALACFVTVDNGFGLDTAKEEGEKKKSVLCIKAMINCLFYFPPKNYLLLRLKKANGKAWLSLQLASSEL